MIVVRDVFTLKIGKAKEAKVLWREAVELSKKHGTPVPRALTDLTGPYYTLVWESTFENAAAWEDNMKNPKGGEDWGKWYQKFAPLIDGGRREMFTVVE